MENFAQVRITLTEKCCKGFNHYEFTFNGGTMKTPCNVVTYLSADVANASAPLNLSEIEEITISMKYPK